MLRSGLTVEKYPSRGCGWLVVHDLSRLPLGFNVRLRRQAGAARDALYDTGVDFTQTADRLKADPNWRKSGAVASWWARAAQACCHGGEHYSPYTYAMDGRCSADAGKPRRS